MNSFIAQTNLFLLLVILFFISGAFSTYVPLQDSECTAQTFQENSLCEGENWSMPNGSVWSSDGSVLTGWGYATKKVGTDYWSDPFSNSTRGRGFLKWWKDLADDLGEMPTPPTNYSGYEGLLQALYIHNVQDCYQQCDIAFQCKDLDYTTDYSLFLDGSKYDYMCNINFTSTNPIYMGLFTSSNGAASPKWLKPLGAKYLLESLYDWCQNQSWCGMTLDTSTSEYTATYTGSSYTTQMNVIISLCNDYAIFNGVYDPTDPIWLQQRIYFLQGIADALHKLDTGKAIETIDMNAESGEMGYYCQIGFWNYSKFDSFWENLVNQTLSNVDLPASKFMCNMGGGRIFKRLTELAAEHGMGVGVHGATGLFSWFSAKRMPFLSYDPIIKAYVNNGKPNPYSKIHSDLEVFHLKNNTYGQYRIFRLTSMADLAMGADSLLVTSNTFASKGYAQEKGCSEAKNCYFNYQIATEINAVDFFDWMSYQIGTPASRAPEAFVLMVDSGSEIPIGVDWSQEYEDALKQDNWDEDPDSCRFSKTYLVSPPVTHFGRHMNYLSSVSGGEGISVLPMNETNMKGETSTLKNWVFGYRLPYEARIPTLNGGLYYKISEDFLSTTTTIYSVQIHFKMYSEYGPVSDYGEFALYYSDAFCLWQMIPDSTVQLNTSTMSYDKFYTASFVIDTPISLNAGPGGSNLGIVHKTGHIRPAVFAIRVVRVRNTPMTSPAVPASCNKPVIYISSGSLASGSLTILACFLLLSFML